MRVLLKSAGRKKHGGGDHRSYNESTWKKQIFTIKEVGRANRYTLSDNSKHHARDLIAYHKGDKSVVKKPAVEPSKVLRSGRILGKKKVKKVKVAGPRSETGSSSATKKAYSKVEAASRAWAAEQRKPRNKRRRRKAKEKEEFRKILAKLMERDRGK